MRIFLTGSTSYLGTKFIDLYGNKFEILGVAAHDPLHPVDLLDTEKLAAAYHAFIPDLIIHLAADLGRDAATASEITKTNPSIVEHLINLALPGKTPVIFTSTEAVYGGKWDSGDYRETDPYEPRSPYGASKVASEKLLMASGLPYLITRGHRYVGISPRFHKSKQFPDTFKSVTDGAEVHLDSKKIFNPALINHICAVFNHYIAHDLGKQILVNVGTDKKTTYYGFVADVAKALGPHMNLIKDDGDEAGWPINSSLNVSKLSELGYPTMDYEALLATIVTDAN